MSNTLNPTPAVTLQSWLTRRWEQACDWLDKGEPYSERWWKNLDEWTQGMVRFEAVERSLRRAGFKGCIRNEGCREQAVSCATCVEAAAQPQLEG